MNINRHNYEEYFILYMDNELSSEERRMVEAFVQEHPDLGEELELLQQFKLEPDEAISFSYKEDLMKENGESLITLNNYEEWLILYADNELSNEQRIKVEAFINSHPTIAAELQLLQKTKLQPELIVFQHKELLYRHNRKVRPIAFKWWRAVAAIFILAFSLTALLILNNENKDADGRTAGTNAPDKGKTMPPLVKQETPAEKNTNNTAGVNQPVISNKENNVTPVYKQAVANNIHNAVQKDKKPVKQKMLVDEQQENNEAPVVAELNQKQDNNLPKPVQNPFVNSPKEDKVFIAANTPPVKNDNNNSATNQIVTTSPAEPSDYILASNDGKKNKNRGIFRKLARTFEKRTSIDPTDDGDRLLVAGFAINMK